MGDIYTCPRTQTENKLIKRCREGKIRQIDEFKDINK